MDQLLENAARILEAARGCAGAERDAGGWTFLLGSGGAIEMIADDAWPLEALRRERGAALAFRVGAAGGRIAVEGTALGRACRLETETTAAVARRLLDRPPAYTLAAAALPPAGA